MMNILFRMRLKIIIGILLTRSTLPISRTQTVARRLTWDSTWLTKGARAPLLNEGMPIRTLTIKFNNDTPLLNLRVEGRVQPDEEQVWCSSRSHKVETRKDLWWWWTWRITIHLRRLERFDFEQIQDTDHEALWWSKNPKDYVEVFKGLMDF